MTEELFRNDSYLRECQAVVTGVDERGIQLDKTVFYPTGGGQPGDTGSLVLADGSRVAITNTVKDRESGDLLHLPAEDSVLPEVGQPVTAVIDWDRRYSLMRMHSAMHVLCSLIDGGVTGGSVGTDRSRIDFDLAESPDKAELEARINQLISEGHAVEIGSISDEELEANPELIRTMSVKPPMGAGQVRTVRIQNVDYQPCGGTHVRSSSEIGAIRVGKIEKKGRQNRRINIHLVDE